MGLMHLKYNFNNYIDEYYTNSYIIIMFIVSDILLYINKVNKLINVMDINIKQYHNVITSKIIKSIDTILILYVSKKFIHTNISHDDDQDEHIIKYIQNLLFYLSKFSFILSLLSLF
jgi:hypothetical protein